MRFRSSSFAMSCLAIALVCSGVSRCFVSGTSLPSMRARNTSPALICRSDAPRSTAALMIFSIMSVSRLEVDDVRQRRPCKIALDVVNNESRLTCPELIGDAAHVGTHQDTRVLPKRMVGRQRLGGKDVERRPALPAFIDQVEQRMF